MTNKLQKGFTLIELLVVIAIVGILAAVVLVAINPAQRIAEANDSDKKSAVGQVATALESCFTQNQGQYDNCGTTTGTAISSTHPLVTGGYLKATGTITSVGVRVTTGASGNAIAYIQLAAQSNIPGGACASNLPMWIYRTSTGASGSGTPAKAECLATPPAVT